jgi:hypothetical protein
VSQRQLNVEEVINIQVYIIFTVYSTTDILQNSIINHLYMLKIHLRSKRIEAALNFALSFLRFVTLGGKVCKILMPA